MTLKSWDSLSLQERRNVRKLYAHLKAETSTTLTDWGSLDGITRRSKVNLWNEIASKIDLPTWKQLTYKQKLSRKQRWNIIYSELTVTQRNLSFTVTDDEDEPTAISGAKVTVDNKKTGTTGAQGGCTVSSVGDGEHTVKVTKTGYEDYTDTVTSDSTHTSFTIELTAVTEEETDGDS